MTCKKLTVFLFIFFCSLISYAQPTHVITDREKDFKQAQNLFLEGEFGLAYPLLRELRNAQDPSHASSNTYLHDDVNFYFIICELKLMQESGAEDGETYITDVNNDVRKRQMCFHLGHYYYLNKDFAAAIKYFDQTKYANLTNEQIADAKFELAYSLFNEKEFNRALPLFGEIIQIESNKYYIPSHYYYGFISYYNKDYAQALPSFRKVEADPEYNAVVPYYVSEILYAQGRKQDALQYSDSALKAGGGSYYRKNMELIAGQLYFEKKDYKKALPYLESYANTSEKITKELMYELSYCYYQNGNSKKAIEGFKQLSSEKDSMGQNSMYLLGELYLKAGDRANARTAFQFCASNNSNADQQRVSRFNYAKLSYELDYQDIALGEIRRFIRDYPNSEFDTEAKEIMVGLLSNTNNFDEGLELYKTIGQTTPVAQKAYARLLYGKSMQLINDQQAGAADELLTKILSISNAGNAIGYANYWKGEIAYRQQRYDDAIKHLNTFLDSKLSWQGEANLMNANYTLGYCWFQKAQYKTAAGYFEKVGLVLKTGATAVEQDAYVRAADCYYAQKDFAKAGAMYDVVSNGNFSQADYALYQKAMIAGVKSGSEKIKLLNTLVKMYPQSSLLLDVQMEIALTYIADEKFSDAVPYLTKLINNEDASGIRPKALLKLGLAYYNSNDNKNALDTYKKLIKQYPHAEESEEALVIIKDIYMEDGKADEYLDLMKENGIVVNVNVADSLSYTSAYNKWTLGDCVAAQTGFNNYLSKNPSGAYVIDANYYKARCAQQSKEFVNAIAGYEYVNSRGVSRFFEDATLQLARIYYFEQKDYTNARKYFESLQANATNPENQLEALRGLVRVYYQQKDYATANTSSQDLLTRKGISTDDKAIAGLVLGKAQETAGDTVKAIESFKTVVPISKSAWGAEARYELGICYLSQGNLNLSEKYAMSVIKETGSYDNWVTQAYILLGDIFMAHKDYFNARATYESVANNAAIPELRDKARQKLQAANDADKKSSKLSN